MIRPWDTPALLVAAWGAGRSFDDRQCFDCYYTLVIGIVWYRSPIWW